MNNKRLRILWAATVTVVALSAINARSETDRLIPDPPTQATTNYRRNP
jgi:hypothetical protein